MMKGRVIQTVDECCLVPAGPPGHAYSVVDCSLTDYWAVRHCSRGARGAAYPSEHCHS